MGNCDLFLCYVIIIIITFSVYLISFTILFVRWVFFILFLFSFSNWRASRDDMAATAQGSTAYPKSESTHSGLVGNIHGQDVEASKGVYWWNNVWGEKFIHLAAIFVFFLILWYLGFSLIHQFMRVFSSELLTATSTTPLPYLKTVYVRRNCKKKCILSLSEWKKMNHPIVTLLKIQIRPTLKATLNEKEEKPKKGINIDQ